MNHRQPRLIRIPAADLVPESTATKIGRWLGRLTVNFAILFLVISAITGGLVLMDRAFSLFPRGL